MRGMCDMENVIKDNVDKVIDNIEDKIFCCHFSFVSYF